MFIERKKRAFRLFRGRRHLREVKRSLSDTESLEKKNIYLYSLTLSLFFNFNLKKIARRNIYFLVSSEVSKQ